MPRLRSVLSEVGEVAIAVVWWGGAHVWGALVGIGLLVTPLLLAVLLDAALAPQPVVALAGGVVGAYAVGLWPWDAELPSTLGAVIVGSTLSAVGWHLSQGTGGIDLLLVALAVAIIGWPVRRFAVTAYRHADTA